MDREKGTQTEYLGPMRAYPGRASCPSPTADPEPRDLGRLFDTCPDLLCITDMAGRFEYVNPSWKRSLDWGPEVLVGAPLTSFVHPDHRDGSTSEIEKLAAGATARRFEHRFRRADGSYRWLQWHVRRAPGDDRLYCTVRDVTRRKRLEREILEILDHERMRLGQDLHDGLCQQLAGIAALSWRLASRTGASPEVSDRAAEISRLLNDSIGEARDLVRGLVPAGLEESHLADALGFLAHNIEKLFDIACELRCDGAVPVLAGPVKRHLFRIAQEAARNSAVHSGGDRIEIGLRCSDGMLTLCVRDNGEGIPHSITGSDGFGLHTMAYRSRQIRASLHIGRADGGGTLVCCDLPLRENRVEASADG